MFGISLPELIVVGIVCLIAFGPAKLPELAKTLGGLSAHIRKASATLRRDFSREVYPPLPDNPLTQARRELETVKTDVKAVFTGAAYDEGFSDRFTNCETKAHLEKANAEKAAMLGTSSEIPDTTSSATNTDAPSDKSEIKSVQAKLS